MNLPAFSNVGLAAAWVRARTGALAPPRFPMTPAAGAVGRRPFLRLVVGASHRDRLATVASLLDQGVAQAGSGIVVVEADPHWWPFHEDPLATVPAGAMVVVLHAARAFPSVQANGTRLVLTHSLFSLPGWVDRLRRVGATGLLMEADRGELRSAAGEALDVRGEWAECEVVSIDVPDDETAGRDAAAAADLTSVAQGPEDDIALRLGAAFALPSPIVRLERCQDVVSEYPDSAIARLALASACMEHAALDDASSSLARAAELQPDWGAVEHEQGKLHLRTERLDLAAEAFARAANRLPRFSPAFVNLGAALGELGRPHEALVAFHEALAIDPLNAHIVNNVGVTLRDLGRLEEAEAAFLRVIDMSPGFVFGHYNLGHTRFLLGRFVDAVEAYERGQARDPHRNAVQASRLGYARLASGDAARGLLEVEAALRTISDERRDALIEEGLEIEAGLRALVPTLAGLDDLRVLLDQSRWRT